MASKNINEKQSSTILERARQEADPIDQKFGIPNQRFEKKFGNRFGIPIIIFPMKMWTFTAA